MDTSYVEDADEDEAELGLCAKLMAETPDGLNESRWAVMTVGEAEDSTALPRPLTQQSAATAPLPSRSAPQSAGTTPLPAQSIQHSAGTAPLPAQSNQHAAGTGALPARSTQHLHGVAPLTAPSTQESVAMAMAPAPLTQETPAAAPVTARSTQLNTPFATVMTVSAPLMQQTAVGAPLTAHATQWAAAAAAATASGRSRPQSATTAALSTRGIQPSSREALVPSDRPKFNREVRTECEDLLPFLCSRSQVKRVFSSTFAPCPVVSPTAPAARISASVHQSDHCSISNFK